MFQPCAAFEAALFIRDRGSPPLPIDFHDATDIFVPSLLLRPPTIFPFVRTILRHIRRQRRVYVNPLLDFVNVRRYKFPWILNNAITSCIFIL